MLSSKMPYTSLIFTLYVYVCQIENSIKIRDLFKLCFKMFNWSLIALHCCVAWLLPYNSVNQPKAHMCPFPFSHLPTLHSPAHLSKFSQSSRQRCLCYTAASYWLSVLPLVMCIFQRYCLSSPHFFFPHLFHKSVLHMYIPLPVQQIGSSVSFFQIPHIMS